MTVLTLGILAQAWGYLVVVSVPPSAGIVS